MHRCLKTNVGEETRKLSFKLVRILLAILYPKCFGYLLIFMSIEIYALLND